MINSLLAVSSGMEKRDSRSLTPETQGELRRQAIHLLKTLKPRQVADQLEVIRNVVYEWIKANKTGGKKALKVKNQGRPKGTGLTLSEDQQARSASLYMMPFAL